MNYLAHALLAHDDDALLLGGFLGDHVRGRLIGKYPPAVEAGIALHRAIDAHSDRHPAVVRSKRRLRPPFRRYAGVMIDMFYDHFLARNWRDYSNEPLDVLARRCYQLLDEHRALLPPSLKRFARHMRSHDLLVRYGDRATLADALAGMSHRARWPNPLADGISVLTSHERALHGDFREYFPQLTQHVEDWRNNHFSRPL